MCTKLFEWNSQDRLAGGLERLLEFNNKLKIKRPIAEVFQFLSNFENMPKWIYFLVNVKKSLMVQLA
jgi:uncharacterized membrane protein